MNLVNTYLLLPLQRKLFKNFGHYDYQTSTFHLNEERVNEVFFDPAFNPFVDVLRETSHASAVASSKSAPPASSSPPPPLQSCSARGAGTGTEGVRRTGSTRGEALAEKERPVPCVQLLQGSIRSAGLVSFFRQMTAQKSLAVEAVDLVFSVAAGVAGAADTAGVSLSGASYPATTPSSKTVSAMYEDEVMGKGGADDVEKRLEEDAVEDRDAGAGSEDQWSESTQQHPTETAGGVMAHSYSLEDQFSLLSRLSDPSQSTPATQPPSSPTATAPSPGSSTAFHTVGDLVKYLKKQLQGVTVGVEEVRLTFCIPPSSALSSPSTVAAPPALHGALKQSKTPLLPRGTRVLHLSCHRGLRFTVEETAGAAVEDMQCAAVVNDWQCYLHVMADDGVVPTSFPLDELIFTTTANVTSNVAAAPPAGKAERDGADAAPITVHLARQSASPQSNGDLSGSAAAASQGKMLLDVEATGGWSVVLTAMQLAHLSDVLRLITHASASQAEPAALDTQVPRSSTTPPPSLSSRWLGKGSDGLRDGEGVVPLESAEAVAAAALAATHAPSVAKYICVHSAGCSVTLLTQAVVEPGVVARAWCAALSAQQASRLGKTADAQEGDAARPPGPVFEALASPHFTYVMRDVDVLFPNIESGNSSSATSLSRVFAADRKKRVIFRNLFKNNLADPAVTERLAQAQRQKQLAHLAGQQESCQSCFVGVGSIALVEYRRAAPQGSTRAPRLLRPAQLLHAERLPYALVVFHRSTSLLTTNADAHLQKSTHNAEAARNMSTTLPSSSEPLCVHQETIVVGLASIAVQLDPELLEVLTAYALTVGRLMDSLTPHAASTKKGSRLDVQSTPSPPKQPSHQEQQQLSQIPTSTVRTRSTVKLLLESLEASIRFPLHRFSPTEQHTTGAAASASTDAQNATTRPSVAFDAAEVPPAIAEEAPFAALPTLLTRLLQRLRETSLHTHHHTRTEIARQAQARGTPKQHHKRETDPLDGSGEGASVGSAERMRLLASVQEKLGFPEDVCGRARFFPEFLRFSIRDLQLIQEEFSSSDGATIQKEEPTTASADALLEPLCTSIKWREAVVYMHDVLGETKSELLRVDYSPAMSIRVTHARLPDSVAQRRWHALRRVLTLQVRLGDITTTVFTQDDYLLASYYVAELLQTLALCRQRMHRLLNDDTVAAFKGGPPDMDKAASAGSPSAVPTAEPASEGPRHGVTPNSTSAMLSAAQSAQESNNAAHAHPGDGASGTVAEAFAVADAHTASKIAMPRSSQAGEGGVRCDADEVGGQSTGSGNPLPPCGSEVVDLVPDLWCYPETTCTALDVQIGRVRLGLFAPRLSPMGQVIGEPLFRCLPAAQRRQMMDLSCLYHTYLMEIVDVSLCGLVGSGAIVGKGQESFVVARFSGLSLWERQPLALPAGSERRDRGGGGGGGASGSADSSLYSSFVTGAVQSPSALPLFKGVTESMQRSSQHANGKNGAAHDGGGAAHNGSGIRRDLEYYLSNSQHRGSALVQLVQSYTEAKMKAEEEAVHEADQRTNGAQRRDEGFVQEVWTSYLRELKARAPEAAQTTSEEWSTTCFVADGGVCEVRFLGSSAETMKGPSSSPSPPPPLSGLHAPENTQMVRIRLTGLGLHHTVAYNGDHLAATLKNYFSRGEIAEDGVAGGAAGDAMNSPSPAPNSTSSKDGTTVVWLEVANLMATYRPRGVGRSLAVVLLPRASVLVHAPAPAQTPAVNPADSRASQAGFAEMGKKGESTESAAQLPLAMQAQAWLHTSVPIYVCNDCDVEALAREVLDPTESDDWGMDLEGAGFVRLCEVLSTAPALPAAHGPSGLEPSLSMAQGWAVQMSTRQPNLIVTLPQPGSAVQGVLREGTTSDSEGIAVSDSESTVAVRVRYLELSAFMAKDAFDVLRELVETWGAGADLQVMDTPAALVMRSGPGFEWVAEEVARSCAPMTFRLNPALATATAGNVHGKPLFDENEGVAPLRPQRQLSSVEGVAGGRPPVRQHDFVSAATQEPHASFSSSPLGLPTQTSTTDVSSTLPSYGYSRWRDSLYAAQGRDQRLSEAYRSRVTALLDQRTPWVSVRCATAPVPSAPSEQRVAAADTVCICSDEEVEDRAARTSASGQQRAQSPPYTLDDRHRMAGLNTSSAPSSPAAATGVSSVSSSFSDLSDLEAVMAPLQWHVLPLGDPHVAFSESTRGIPAAVLTRAPADVIIEDDGDDDMDADAFDLCAACERHPHFLSCWSRDRVDAVLQSSAINLNHLDRTDDALLHDTAERYLYPPVALQFFLCDCALNVSLYEGTDLMAAAVRKQRQGYLQIVSRGARVAQAAAPYSMYGKVNSQRGRSPATHLKRHAGGGDAANDNPSHSSQPNASLSSRASTSVPEAPSETSASRLGRLSDRGCRSGFGDRDASKRLVLSCRGITVQMDTFPQGSEEDLWFHIVAGEVTVFDCIEASDVHRLLTATPQLATASTRSTVSAPAAFMSASPHSTGYAARGRDQGSTAPESHISPNGDQQAARQLELTGLLTSSKSVHMAPRLEAGDDARPGFTVSHFQQGGSELSVVVRLQPTSLTWSGASVDFAQSFFFSSPASSSATASTPPAASSSGNGGTASRSGTADTSWRAGVSPSSSAASAGGGVAVSAAAAKTDDGVISGTEAPPIFFRRVVILPTTLTIAGSFQSDKGVLAALAEGKSLDALRSVPVLSWISVQEIPLPIPHMRIEDCSSAVTLLQRIVEDSNCVSIRFLLTALCCGLQPISAVARVGEAAKGLLLLPLSQYRGAALHHAIRTASSVFMQELLTQTSGVAALLASGSYHASRSLLEVLVAPSDRRLAVSVEPSRALQPSGVVDGWRQGQEQLRTGLEEALTMASYCTGPDGSLLRLPAAALRMLMGISGAATTTLWGVRNSQSSSARTRDGFIYKK